MLAIASILLICVQTAQIQSDVDLRLEIEREIKNFPGKVWIAACNLNKGITFNLAGDERVRTASTIKLPILVALHGEVKEGRLSWEEKLVVTKKTRAQGAGILLEMDDGHSLTLREASKLMVVVSDNIATNLILERMGIDKVNAWMDKLQLPKTRSLAWIGGEVVSKARSADWNKRADGSTYGIGVTTPYEMVNLLTRLAQGEIISPEDSKQILALMGRQQYKDGIGRNMRGASVANKPGALDRLRSDVGIITVGKEKFALAITLDDMTVPPDWSPDNAALKMLSKLSEVLIASLKSQQEPKKAGATKP